MMGLDRKWSLYLSA